MKGIIDKSLDVNYNLDYIVIVPKEDEELVEFFAYTFGNTLLFNNTIEDLEYVTRFLRDNVVGQLIFVDYYAEYNEIINTLVNEHEIKFIFTKGLGDLFDPAILCEYNCICDKYDERSIDEIGFLDPFLFKAAHNKRRNTKHVMLDCEYRGDVVSKVIKGSKMIGILNSDLSNQDSFYNELSAVAFLSEYKAKVMNPTKTTIDFAKEYNVKILAECSFESLISDNDCNMCISFAGSNPIVFIKSMDAGVPCIIGNNYFLSGYPVLSSYVVMESDDDVNEIAERLNKCIENKGKILREYKKFRKEYSRKSRELVNEFLGIKIHSKKETTYSKLLTVVVPVYNTEKYLARCLDSIVQASIENMEILVINDGSTDGSEEIIKEHLERYPDLIRYIKQKNGGLGHVRNVGLKEAKGKYLASVDSDDTIDAEFLESALSYMEKDIDVVVCDWMSISEKESFETVALDWVFNKRKVMEGILYTTIMPSTCNKIFKKSLFLDNRIEYLEQKYEDLSANPLALLKAETVKYIRKPYYDYYLRDNSLMRSKVDPREMADALVYLDKRLDIMNETMNVEEFKHFTYSWRIEEYILNPLYDLNKKELDEASRYIYKNVYELIKDILESQYYKKMLRGLRSKELKDFIEKRNAAFIEKRLKEFILETKEPKKLTAGIIYYGD